MLSRLGEDMVVGLALAAMWIRIPRVNRLFGNHSWLLIIFLVVMYDFVSGSTY
jgi:hypothetical protein